ncbi:MAG: adenine phosphoribosyltransferase [Candidatus Methanoplasma sp.]|jgi:adenine phosphoribosyltransferase|nr:adenine phosphoribosyltransferase [Candidatus Methanoplasma sp.]
MSGRIEASIPQCPVADKNGYPYIIHPLTDGIPEVEPEMLEEAAEWMAEVFPADADAILVPEAMGIPLAAALSLKVGVPYSVIRKRSYGLPGEVHVRSKTGYSSSDLYINGIRKGCKAVLVDDILSTGGTLEALAPAIRAAGAEISAVLTVFDKGSAKDRLERDLGLTIRRMFVLSVENGRPNARRA